MTMFSMKLDAKAECTLADLRVKLGAASKAEVLRTAVALLMVAQEGLDNGLIVTLSDVNNVVQKELVLPQLVQPKILRASVPSVK